MSDRNRDRSQRAIPQTVSAESALIDGQPMKEVRTAVLAGYADFLADVKLRIQTAQLKLSAEPAEGE